MARTVIGLSLAVALVSAFLCGRSLGLSPTCTNTLLTLAPCLDYMKGKSSAPAPSCCSQLGSVVALHAECLCVLLDGEAESLGFKFNQTQALGLPAACNVETPPLSECKGVSGAAGSPATPSSQSPSPSSPAKPSTGPAPVGSTPANISTGAAAAAPVDHTAHAVADHADADAGHADAGKGTSTTTESSSGSSHESMLLPTIFSALFVAVCVSSSAL